MQTTDVVPIDGEILDHESGELIPASARILPVPTVGGLPVFPLEEAAELRKRITQYEDDVLRDDHYVFYASWVQNGRSKRIGFDNRADAEQKARQSRGRVELVKRATAYDMLAMPLNISGEPAPDFDDDRGCRSHDGKHVVHTRGWKVSVPGGRFAIERGTVATCEKMSSTDQQLFWGKRIEHDAVALAERRAYVRAMKRLLGFGEPAPYIPEGAAAPPTAQPAAPAATAAPVAEPVRQAIPDDKDWPTDTTSAWTRFWPVAHECGLDRLAVHRLFKVEERTGALAEYVAFVSQKDDIPQAEVIHRLRDRVVAGPSAAPAPVAPA